MKFIAVYMAPVGTFDEMMTNATPEQQKQGMDSWMSWSEKHKAMLSDVGNPTGKNMRVTTDGVEAVRDEVCGYSIAQANSHEEAVEIFKDCPFLETKGTYIDVLEAMPM
jgi:hypothetical protein